MKKSLLIIALMLLLIVPLTVSAHRGRTDENGGHYDRSSGEYHYHHGYPAHQHENGICPYDYDVKTNKNSGNGGSSSIDEEDEEREEETTVAITTKKTYSANEKSTPSKSNNKVLKSILYSLGISIVFLAWIVFGFVDAIFEKLQDIIFKDYSFFAPTTIIWIFSFIATWSVTALIFLKKSIMALICAVLLFLLLFVVWYFVCKQRNKKAEKDYIAKQKELEEQRILEQEELERKRILRQKNLKKEKLKYLIYINKTKTELFNLINNTNIDIQFDDKNLPVPDQPEVGKYGEYTVFLTQRGKRIHRKPSCCGATIEKFVFDIKGEY